MKNSPPSVAVILVNYNGLDDTKSCLRSFNKIDQNRTKLTFFVVDNGSTVGNPQVLKKLFSKINLLIVPKNLGFAGGNNLAIKKALSRSFDYILLVNNDALVIDPLMIEKLIGEDQDIAGPIIECKGAEGKIYDFGGVVDYTFGRNTHLTFTHFSAKPGRSPDYVSGACLLVRPEIFRRVGCFNHKYFLYYEDADFCLRAKASGYRIGVCRKTILHHKLSASTNKLGSLKLVYLSRSHKLFCAKHLAWYKAPFYLSYNLYLRLKVIFS